MVNNQILLIIQPNTQHHERPDLVYIITTIRMKLYSVRLVTQWLSTFLDNVASTIYIWTSQVNVSRPARQVFNVF